MAGLWKMSSNAKLRRKNGLYKFLNPSMNSFGSYKLVEQCLDY